MSNFTKSIHGISDIKGANNVRKTQKRTSLNRRLYQK